VFPIIVAVDTVAPLAQLSRAEADAVLPDALAFLAFAKLQVDLSLVRSLMSDSHGESHGSHSVETGLLLSLVGCFKQYFAVHRRRQE
jgi:hypothetical protein